MVVNYIPLLREELEDLYTVMVTEEMLHKFPLCGGSVLSAIRHGGLLNPKDEDIDFHIFREHEPSLNRLTQVLLNSGMYKLKYKYFNSNKELSEVTLVRHNQSKYGIDFNVLDYTTDNDYLQYTCYIGVDSPEEIIKRIPSSTYMDLTQSYLEGLPFYVPSNANLYLESMYGKEWETPKSGFQYWNKDHAPSVYDVVPWKGYAIVYE